MQKKQRVNPDRFMSDEEIREYALEHNLDYVFCIDCGKVINDSKSIYLSMDKTKFMDQLNGATFLKTREYNGHEYRLCRCKDCVAKKFPNILNSKCLYAQKWAKYCKYAFNVSDEDFDDLSSERQRITKEKMINRWGEELGLQKWNDYCSKQSETNTYEYKHNKYGMSWTEFNQYNHSRAVTLENLVSKYGEEEGTKRFNDYCERQSYTTSKEYFIETYGEEEGIKKFDEFDRKRMDVTDGRGYSLISKELFDRLSNEKLFENHVLSYADSEMTVRCPKNNYHLDFYDHDLNLSIEFQGTYFHRDKEEQDIQRMKNIQETIDNYAIFVLEKSYCSNKKEVIQKICEYVSRIPMMSKEEKETIFII